MNLQDMMTVETVQMSSKFFVLIKNAHNITSDVPVADAFQV